MDHKAIIEMRKTSNLEMVVNGRRVLLGQVVDSGFIENPSALSGMTIKQTERAKHLISLADCEFNSSFRSRENNLWKQASQSLKRSKAAEDCGLECVRCHKTILTRDGEEPTKICDHCAHDLLSEKETECRCWCGAECACICHDK